MKKIRRFVNYVSGIEVKPKPTFSNDGPSSHTWILAGCHPKDSITWHWAVYCSTPSFSFKWFFHMRIRIYTQKLMY